MKRQSEKGWIDLLADIGYVCWFVLGLKALSSMLS